MNNITKINYQILAPRARIALHNKWAVLVDQADETSNVCSLFLRLESHWQVHAQKIVTHYSANKTTLCQIRNMIINLSKGFHFSRNHNEYQGKYIFKNNKNPDGHTDVCLELKVSVNGKEEKDYSIIKPTAVLFQSNDVIEEMIADEVVGFSLP